jgi:hypothetical protein
MDGDGDELGAIPANAGDDVPADYGAALHEEKKIPTIVEKLCK